MWLSAGLEAEHSFSFVFVVHRQACGARAEAGSAGRRGHVRERRELRDWNCGSITGIFRPVNGRRDQFKFQAEPGMCSGQRGLGCFYRTQYLEDKSGLGLVCYFSSGGISWVG